MVDKDVERNVLIVGQGKNHPLLFSNGFSCKSTATGLITKVRSARIDSLDAVKTRYRQEDVPCEVFPDDRKRSALRSFSMNLNVLLHQVSPLFFMTALGVFAVVAFIESYIR